jgi:hypothetical protein
MEQWTQKKDEYGTVIVVVSRARLTLLPTLKKTVPPTAKSAGM